MEDLVRTTLDLMRGPGQKNGHRVEVPQIGTSPHRER